MHLPSLPFRLTRPAPDAAVAEALLRLLDSHDTDWDEIAQHAMRDASLTLALLWMAPLAPGEPPTLGIALSQRLARAGRPLLRAWLMHAGSRLHQIDSIRRCNARALLIAEATMHLAIEKRYPRPDEAYLAGLWRGVGELSLIASTPDYLSLREQYTTPAALRLAERQRFGADHVQLAASLGEHCGLPRWVVDAVALSSALEEYVHTAHPLAGILRTAICLTDPSPRMDEAARLSGLSVDSLDSLKADVNFLSSQGLKEIGIGLPVATNNHRNAMPAYPVLSPGWRALTLSGLLAGLFDASNAAQIHQRLTDAFRLMFGKSAPLMLTVVEGVITPLVPEDRRLGATDLSELGLKLDDETSVVALAIRTQSSTSHFPGADGPGRSARDWHLTRWLAASGILCLPWQTGARTGVAVLGIDESLDLTPDDQQVMGQLIDLAARALTTQWRHEQQLAELGASLQAAQQEKTRRVTHEIKNPLTVIKSYLGIIAQRDEHNTTLTNELDNVSKEIDRVSALLRRLSDPEDTSPEPSNASVSEVVRELEHLYGEPLFGQHGRELDIRIPGGLPRVAMPASALKQVLLNLMRNAAEALSEGRRLSITAPGTLIADGVRSLEIRLLDNGPGIPDQRLRRLFEPANSTKSGDHQGIGLSIVKEILGEWRAYILCRSQQNQGTSFQLFIPLEDAS